MSSDKRGVMHDLSPKNKKNPTLLIIIGFAVLLGVGSGFIATRLFSGSSIAAKVSGGNATSVEKGDIVGSDDTETYSDEAEGKLVEGGIEGEGAYHLERDGGENRYVYLTSATVDLSKFVGKNVKVWGQTHASTVAPWLMEVGRLQLLE